MYISFFASLTLLVKKDRPLYSSFLVVLAPTFGTVTETAFSLFDISLSPSFFLVTLPVRYAVPSTHDHRQPLRTKLSPHGLQEGGGLI